MAAVSRRLAPLVPAALGRLPRCTLCTWKPELRLDRIKMSFARSSGAVRVAPALRLAPDRPLPTPLAPPQGGQNVNKVNTKAELRFNLSEVRCMPPSPPLCLLTLLPTLTDAEFGLVASRRGRAPG